MIRGDIIHLPSGFQVSVTTEARTNFSQKNKKTDSDLTLFFQNVTKKLQKRITATRREKNYDFFQVSNSKIKLKFRG